MTTTIQTICKSVFVVCVEMQFFVFDYTACNTQIDLVLILFRGMNRERNVGDISDEVSSKDMQRIESIVVFVRAYYYSMKKQLICLIFRCARILLLSPSVFFFHQ